jgi:hypothetical protein
MGEVIKFRKRSTTEGQGNTLCRSGFHKWKVVTEKRFDVRQGRLVTVLRCERCGKEKTELR